MASDDEWSGFVTFMKSKLLVNDERYENIISSLSEKYQQAEPILNKIGKKNKFMIRVKRATEFLEGGGKNPSKVILNVLTFLEETTKTETFETAQKDVDASHSLIEARKRKLSGEVVENASDVPILKSPKRDGKQSEDANNGYSDRGPVEDECCSKTKSSSEMLGVVVESMPLMQSNEGENEQTVEEDSSSQNASRKVDKKEANRELYISQLEGFLFKLQQRIKKEEARELSLDDLDQEESAYLMLDKLKAKAFQIFRKLQELKKEKSTTQRQQYRAIKFSGTKFADLNEEINQLINKSIEAPDFVDVFERVKKYNDVHNKFEDIKFTSTEIFRNIVKLFKKRRLFDLNDVMENEFINLKAEDPADKDAELREKLAKNKTLSKTEDELLLQYAEADKYAICVSDAPFSCSVEDLEELIPDCFDVVQQDEKFILYFSSPDAMEKCLQSADANPIVHEGKILKLDRYDFTAADVQESSVDDKDDEERKEDEVDHEEFFEECQNVEREDCEPAQRLQAISNLEGSPTNNSSGIFSAGIDNSECEKEAVTHEVKPAQPQSELTCIGSGASQVSEDSNKMQSSVIESEPSSGEKSTEVEIISLDDSSDEENSGSASTSAQSSANNQKPNQDEEEEIVCLD